jgi:hypothetical protein
MIKYSAETIIGILHSIRRIERKDKEVDFYLSEDTAPSSAAEYKRDSFTQQLLLLIEDYLKEDA